MRIQLSFNRATFELQRHQGESWINSRTGNHTYTIRQYSDFNELLSKQWFMRVNGDFSYATLETIRFFMEPRSTFILPGHQL